MNDMQRTALRKAFADKMTIAMGVVYTLLIAGAFALGLTAAGIVWAVVYTAIYAGCVWLTYRANIRRLARDLAWATERHEHDLRMERLAQECDAIATGGPEAEAILARYRADRAVREHAARVDRQARIAAFEAEELTRDGVRLTG